MLSLRFLLSLWLIKSYWLVLGHRFYPIVNWYLSQKIWKNKNNYKFYTEVSSWYFVMPQLSSFNHRLRSVGRYMTTNSVYRCSMWPIWLKWSIWVEKTRPFLGKCLANSSSCLASHVSGLVSPAGVKTLGCVLFGKTCCTCLNGIPQKSAPFFFQRAHLLCLFETPMKNKKYHRIPWHIGSQFLIWSMYQWLVGGL